MLYDHRDGDIIHTICINLELEDFITLILVRVLPIAIDVLTEDEYWEDLIYVTS